MEEYLPQQKQVACNQGYELNAIMKYYSDRAAQLSPDLFEGITIIKSANNLGNNLGFAFLNTHIEGNA